MYHWVWPQNKKTKTEIVWFLEWPFTSDPYLLEQVLGLPILTWTSSRICLVGWTNILDYLKVLSREFGLCWQKPPSLLPRQNYVSEFQRFPP